MFSLTALDRPALAQLTRAARAAHGCAFAPFKSSAEANALAQRCGLDEEIDAESLRNLMRIGSGCHWCQKSLGKKLTCVFAHLRPLALGGANTVENVAVVCQQCARSRAALQVCEPPSAVGPEKRLSSGSLLTLAEAETEALDPSTGLAAEFHAGWVYASPGGDGRPWVFLVWGDSGFTERLQHLRYGAPSGATEFHVAQEPHSAFRGLVVRSGDVAETMLREVHRAGKVMVLPG